MNGYCGKKRKVLKIEPNDCVKGEKGGKWEWITNAKTISVSESLKWLVLDKIFISGGMIHISA